MNEILELYNEEERRSITDAYKVAEQSLEGIRRGNNSPFIGHAAGVAHIVAKELGLMSDAVVATFIHEALRFDETILDSVSKRFSPDIIDMAISLNKIAAINPKDTRLEAENYRKLIISYSSDPRVSLIKLADRLEVIRNIELLPKSNQKKKITETIMLYVPLAHQLGLYNLKSELEDRFLKYTEPEQYRTITNKLKATERDRENMARNFIIPLREKIDRSGIRYELKTRTKSAYSIWKKMQVQNVPFEMVYDLFAVRFIIDSEPVKEIEHELCWKVYSMVTEEYTPDPSRLRDWLTIPKRNGYESLHTTVTDRSGNSIEVQIRTKRMDDKAENGDASHWMYKGIKRVDSLEKWLSAVKKMLESPDPEKYKQVSDTVLNEIFVFTPTGDLRRLPAGACVLDFAFDIHTNFGLKCSGAKIDGKLVSIKEKLKTGNVIELMSNKNQKPSQDWLNFVVTSKARSKIRQKIKEEETKKAGAGRELLERRLKNWKLEINDEMLHELCKKYKYKSVIEFYSALGEGLADISEIKSFITNYLENDHPHQEREKERVKQKSAENEKEYPTDFLVIDGKLNNVGYKMAKCCNPIFGDDVFGFVSIKEGIKIHRISCPNAARLFDNYPYRIQKVKWKESVKSSNFQSTLKVVTIDDPTVNQVIIDRIHSFNISIRSLYTKERESRKSGGSYDIYIQISVSNNQQLDKLISTIKKVRGVTNVIRVANG